MKNLKYKKQIIFGISLTLFICVLAVLTLFLIFNNKSTLVSSSTSETNILDISNVTNVSLDNTLDTSNVKEEEIPQIITEEKVSEEELKKEKVDKKEVKKATSPYYIKVNYKANTVTIYKKDKNNKYTIPVKAMVCSCGTATPRKGVYKTSSKYRWGKLIHDSYGQYATRIVGSILFHSVPYSASKSDALYYKQYDRLGTTASAGCIRLTVRDSKWIYTNCPSGTMVEFYASSNPGPLGKPTAQKISSVEECRNWDPTDPSKGNPWHTYKPKEDKKEESNSTTNSTVNNTVSNNTITNSSNTADNTNNNSVNNSTNNTNNSVNNTTTNSTTNSGTVNNSVSNNSTSSNVNKNNTTNSSNITVNKNTTTNNSSSNANNTVINPNVNSTGLK